MSSHVVVAAGVNPTALAVGVVERRGVDAVRGCRASTAAASRATVGWVRGRGRCSHVITSASMKKAGGGPVGDKKVHGDNDEGSSHGVGVRGAGRGGRGGGRGGGSGKIRGGAREGRETRDQRREKRVRPFPDVLGNVLRSGMLSAIAAGLMSCSAPQAALAAAAPQTSPTDATTPPGATRTAVASHDQPSSSTAPDPAVAAAAAAAAVDDGAPSSSAAAAPAASPVVPSGTYPLAASAPLPSEAKKLAAAAEEASGKPHVSGRESRAGRLEELNSLRVELDLKELEVREKTQELLRQEQTTAVLQEELELSRRLNGILKTALDQAVEKGKLSMGLCAQVGGVP